jgi:hypothetical protein
LVGEFAREEPGGWVVREAVEEIKREVLILEKKAAYGKYGE